jgi:hypothetical protein
MPTNRKKRTQNLRQLDDRQLANLVNGHHLIDWQEPAFASEKERREAWELNRDWLLEVKDFEGYFFGGSIMGKDTKPAAFYQYEQGLIFKQDFEFERELTPDKTGWIMYFKSLK